MQESSLVGICSCLRSLYCIYVDTVYAASTQDEERAGCGGSSELNGGGGIAALLRSGQLRSRPAAAVWSSPIALPRERAAKGNAGTSPRVSGVSAGAGRHAANRGRSTGRSQSLGASSRGRSRGAGGSQCNGRVVSNAATQRGYGGRSRPLLSMISFLLWII